jgi:hypothetical protein
MQDLDLETWDLYFPGKHWEYVREQYPIDRFLTATREFFATNVQQTTNIDVRYTITINTAVGCSRTD